MAPNSKRFLSAGEWASRLGVTSGRARQLCDKYHKQIKAQRMLSGTFAWMIPEDAPDPRKAWGRPKITPPKE